MAAFIITAFRPGIYENANNKSVALTRVILDIQTESLAQSNLDDDNVVPKSTIKYELNNSGMFLTETSLREKIPVESLLRANISVKLRHELGEQLPIQSSYQVNNDTTSKIVWITVSIDSGGLQVIGYWTLHSWKNNYIELQEFKQEYWKDL